MTITITPPPPLGRRIPGIYDTDAMGHSHSMEEPGWLCSNWYHGCNALSDNGPKNGRLTFCDDCLEEPQTPYL